MSGSQNRAAGHSPDNTRARSQRGEPQAKMAERRRIRLSRPTRSQLPKELQRPAIHHRRNTTSVTPLRRDNVREPSTATNREILKIDRRARFDDDTSATISEVAATILHTAFDFIFPLIALILDAVEWSEESVRPRGSCANATQSHWFPLAPVTRSSRRSIAGSRVRAQGGELVPFGFRARAHASAAL